MSIKVYTRLCPSIVLSLWKTRWFSIYIVHLIQGTKYENSFYHWGKCGVWLNSRIVMCIFLIQYICWRYYKLLTAAGKTNNMVWCSPWNLLHFHHICHQVLYPSCPQLYKHLYCFSILCSKTCLFFHVKWVSNNKLRNSFWDWLCSSGYVIRVTQHDSKQQ